MDRGAWRATDHGVAMNRTQLHNWVCPWKKEDIRITQGVIKSLERFMQYMLFFMEESGSHHLIRWWDPLYYSMRPVSLNFHCTHCIYKTQTAFTVVCKCLDGNHVIMRLLLKESHLEEQCFMTVPPSSFIPSHPSHHPLTHYCNPKRKNSSWKIRLTVIKYKYSIIFEN